MHKRRKPTFAISCLTVERKIQVIDQSGRHVLVAGLLCQAAGQQKAMPFMPTKGNGRLDASNTAEARIR